MGSLLSQRPLGAATLITLAALCATFAYGSAFGTRLFFWFVFWLAAFHWIVGRRVFSQNQLRMIDYPYLSMAAIGLFLLAADEQTDRDEYTREYREITSPSTLSGLRRYVDGSSQLFCSDTNSNSYVPEFCRWAADLRVFLSQDIKVNQLRAKLSESKELLDHADWGGWWEWLEQSLLAISLVPSKPGEVKIVPPNVDIEIVRLQARRAARAEALTIVNSMERIIEAGDTPPAVSTMAPPRHGLPYGVGKTIIWPFVLAVAVALRITRVTAEVSGWAK